MNNPKNTVLQAEFYDLRFLAVKLQAYRVNATIAIWIRYNLRHLRT